MTKPGTYIIAGSYGIKSIHQTMIAPGMELAKLGHKVVFVFDKHRFDLKSSDTNPAYEVWPGYRPSGIKDFFFMLKLIRKYRPKAVIAHFGSVNVSMVASWLLGVPHRFAWIHTLSKQIELDMKVSRLKLNLLRFRKRLVYKLATGFGTNAEATRQDTVETYGIDKNKCLIFPYLMEEPALKGGQERDNTLLAVGRLDRSKGHEFLIRAMPRIRETLGDMRLAIAGEGPLMQELQALIDELGLTESCTLTGSLPYDEVLRSMAAAKVLVTPSLSEAFGLINMEALSVGTPVVGTAVGGIPEILRDGYCGYLIPPGDSDAIYEAVVKSLASEEHYRALQEHSLLHFKSHFSLERAAYYAEQLELHTR